MSLIKILVTSIDYRPRLGGVSTCAYHLCKELNQIKNTKVRLLTPESEKSFLIDKESPFEILRLPHYVKKSLGWPLYLYEMRKNIKEWQPQAVVCLLWLPCGLIMRLNNLFFSKVPYFVIVHGVEMMESERNFKKRVRKKLKFIKTWSLEEASKIFAVSNYTKNLIIQETEISENKIIVNFNGVDPKEFYPKPKMDQLIQKYKLNSQFVIGSCCRLVSHKGIENVIKALNLVIQVNKDLKYLISGDGPELKALKNLSVHLKLEPWVEFTGPIDERELIDFYNLLDCFILTSYEDHKTPAVEGFGIAFLEAAACKKPSIGGRSGGIPDAVIDGETGWLVDPMNINEIAQKIIYVMAHKDEVLKLGEKALERSRNQLTWKSSASRIFNEIENIMAVL